MAEVHGGKTLRVAFLQMPLQEPGAAAIDAARANVPLAPAALAAAARSDRVECVMPPAWLQDHGGDRALADWILGNGFGAVCFSLYLWNRDRSAALARRLKHGGLVTLAGGPEVHEAPAGFDMAVRGEGEEILPELLELLRSDPSSLLPQARRSAGAPGEGRCAGRPAHLLYARRPVNLAAVANPYLEGLLPFDDGKPVYLETMRGCPNRCSYCHYGKRFEGLRFFPAPTVAEVFTRAVKAGATTIYLMDPSFNAAPLMDERLRWFARLNTGGRALHTELRLESVTADRATLLSAAGFRSVEIGLQSVNPAALRRVRRSFNRLAFERGAAELQKRSIEIRTGVILGLPGESGEDFLRTIEYVKSLGLAGGLEIYPLALLPGTELRERAAEFGLDYLRRAPWWVTSTDRMDQGELMRALIVAEEILGIEYFKPIVPGACSVNGLVSWAELRTASDIRALEAQSARLASNLVLIIPAAVLERSQAELAGLAAAVRRDNPYTLTQILVEPDPAMPEAALAELQIRALALTDALRDPAHPFELSQYYRRDTQYRFAARAFLLTLRPELIERCRRGSCVLDPLVPYSPGLLAHNPELFRDLPPVLVPEGPPGVPGPSRWVDESELAALRRAYRGFENLLVSIPALSAAAPADRPEALSARRGLRSRT